MLYPYNLIICVSLIPSHFKESKEGNVRKPNTEALLRISVAVEKQ